MAKEKYLFIFGTRPEVIKVAPVLQALQKETQAECVVCETGQHQELLEPLLSLFKIQPQYRLRVMSHNQQPCGLTARLLSELEKVIAIEQPKWLLVQGDTTTATAGCMAGCYSKVAVAHIEAGLRSHNKHEPFPEEVNRRIIDVMSDVHFAPTETEKLGLMREGIKADSIYVTGNTCIDALKFVSALPFSAKGSVLEKVPLDKRIVLVTVHRRENHGARLQNICEAVRLVARRYRNSAHLVLPVHPNPNVTATVWKHLDGIPNITLTPALGYRELIALANACFFAMVDSGGLQEELPSLGKPALVLRNVTDRPETLVAGVAKLVGTETAAIVSAFTALMEDSVLYQSMAQPRDLYGDGMASKRIAAVLTGQYAGVMPLSAMMQAAQLGIESRVVRSAA
jgi:UDP-N-acetylglucosamine 2-epimerase (non-hydrolysing)